MFSVVDCLLATAVTNAVQRTIISAVQQKIVSEYLVVCLFFGYLGHKSSEISDEKLNERDLGLHKKQEFCTSCM